MNENEKIMEEKADTSFDDKKESRSRKRLCAKFIVSIFLASLWMGISIWIAKGWIAEVREITSLFFMLFALSGIAFIPGFIIMFMYCSMAFDKRHKVDLDKVINTTVLIAAFNEEENVLKPLEAIEAQEFKGELEIIVIDDGSSDKTSDVVRNFISKQQRKHYYRLITLETNSGKSAALNAGLKESRYDVIVSMDADTTLGTSNSLQMLVCHLNNENRSVAGAVVSRNPKKSWITRIQEWDYLFGISLVKRIQSMYSGTLVCQGAFSAYYKSLLIEMGGWKQVVGEDIVLSWDILKAGHKTYHCTKAIALTDTPTTYKMFFHQRKRWSRGMIEAFRVNWRLLFKARLSTIFIWYNLLFPYIDFVFAFIFVPSIIASLFFDYHLLAGEKTLWVIPLSLSLTTILYLVQRKTFRDIGLSMSKNVIGMILYVIFFQVIQTPATLAGYFSEILKLKKNWGTKKSKLIGMTLFFLLSSGLVFSQNNNRVELGSDILKDSDKNIVLKSWVGYGIGKDSLFFTIKTGNTLIANKNKDYKNNIPYTGLSAYYKMKRITFDVSAEQCFSKWKPFLYDGVIAIDPFKNAHIELMFSRSLIETKEAIEDRHSVFSNGISLDFTIKKITLVGAYTNQQFTDNNLKNIYTAKVIWVVKDWFVINFTNKLIRANNTSLYYFCPKRFDTHTISVHKNIAVFNDNIIIKPELGGGLQIVNEYQKGLYCLKLTTKGDITKKISLDLSIIYSNAMSEFGSYGLIFGNIRLYYCF